MVRRHELTDESWSMVEPLLAPVRMGRPVRDRRRVVNGILGEAVHPLTGRL
ncbi:hypothetical protein MOV08_01145 [Streptomyces yunnanensis]|uniref:Transposase of IS4/5 family n=1 Tax=Streptomyces yunnanensis TaxID=156453 RepID=A0ABY8ARH9_9ACTN|nr:hypothetical protein [Streptomyces yunnanensis]WEB46122.1 hypothetical protein MOV08_01145 [Streptomyces yunnanensis]